MKKTKLIMGMPITVEIVDPFAVASMFDEVLFYFRHIDEKFSVYKEKSEITAINRGRLKENDWSDEMKTVFALAEETKKLTDGYFDIVTPSGRYDPSGIVKGWAIYNASRLLEKMGAENFCLEAGGDIEMRGKNSQGRKWRVGIQDPFSKRPRIIKTVYLENKGIATSGTYTRGLHIYNPKEKTPPITEIVSLTVIGPDIYEADRFATAAFAMGKKGINFIERLKGFEGYIIDRSGIGTMTSGFEKYCTPSL